MLHNLLHSSSLILHSSSLPNSLWDWAGVDGLQFGKALFGEPIGRIAPFQSIETHYQNTPCSVLRLCEGNFRLSLPQEVSLEEAIAQSTHFQVWIKPCKQLTTIVLPEAIGLDLLLQIAVTKPIYRLEAIAPHCAVPAQIDHIAVLIWRHVLQEQPTVEIQVSLQDRDAVEVKLEQASH
jgi:hypothetical protein